MSEHFSVPLVLRAPWSRFRRLLATLLAAAAVACAKVEPPRVVELGVSESGGYSVAGKPVPEADLKFELKAVQAEPGSLQLHIVAHPRASYKAVLVALQAAHEAGIDRIAFDPRAPTQ